MKKYKLLLKYFDLKVCALREGNLDAYDRFTRETQDKNSTDYQYARGTYIGFENAMKIISELLDDLKEGEYEH